MKWRVVGALALVVVGGWQLQQGLRQQTPPAVPPPSPAPAAAQEPPDTAAAPRPAAASDAADWARWLAGSSLRGTEPDGDWTVGADGRLRPDPALRRRLDHYLALQGELPLERLRDALVDEVARRHGPQAATDLRQLWARYLALAQYRWQAVADPSRPETLAAALAERTRVRQQLLGPAMAEAFYREEDDRLRATIARLNGGAGPSFASLAPLALHPEPLPDAPVQQLALQQGWAAWEQRLSDAHSEQLRLQAQPGLSAAQRAAAMQAHLDAHFSAAERPRVEALLRLMPR